MTGIFWGEALLIFPESASMELVRLFVKNEAALDQLSELEQEAFTEIGNVILNACVSSLADMLKCNIVCMTPSCIFGTAESLLRVPKRSESQNDTSLQDESALEEVVMFLQVDFLVSKQNLKGFLSFILDVNAIDGFLGQIDSLVAQGR